MVDVGMMDCKPLETQIMINHGLQILKKEKLVDYGRYQRIVEIFMYFAHTRPDITYVVGVVSRCIYKPQE